MTRRLLITIAVLLTVAGCTRPESNVQPAQVPAQAPALAPTPTVSANACRTSATGTLQVQVGELRWQPHPLAPDKLWAPSAVVTACNAGMTQSGEQSLSLFRSDGTPFGPTFFLMPSLQPGEALGPVRLYADTGVPAKAGALWQQDGHLWPALALQAGAAGPSYPVRRSLDVTGPEAPGGGEWPVAPTLAQLRGLALDSVTFSPDGQHQVELFLYDPRARYMLNETPSCASVPGQIDADGQSWSFWASVDGGTPFLAGDAGGYSFPGDRGLYKEVATAGGMTYLYLEQYFGCSNAHVTEVFAFDPSTNAVTRSQMKLETGETVGAVGLVAPDGKLHRSYYSNANNPDFGYHRITYGWDPQTKLWVTESHERSKP